MLHQLFFGIVTLGVTTALIYGTPVSSPTRNGTEHSKTSTEISPYSKEAQKRKEAELWKEYEEARDTLKESEALQGIGSPDSEVSNNDLNETFITNKMHSPSRTEAQRPINEHARVAQELLKKEVKEAGIVANTFTAKKEYYSMGDCDEPMVDTLGELAAEEQEKEGHGIKPTLNLEALPYGGVDAPLSGAFTFP